MYLCWSYDNPTPTGCVSQTGLVVFSQVGYTPYDLTDCVEPSSLPPVTGAPLLIEPVALNEVWLHVVVAVIPTSRTIHDATDGADD